MSAFITTLIGYINSATLWGVVAYTIDIIAISVLFSIGYFIISHTLTDISFARYGFKQEAYKNGRRIW